MTVPAVQTSELGHASPGDLSWWNLAQVERAPDLRWPFNIPTYERMWRTHPVVKAGVQAVFQPILSAQWRVDGRGCDPAVTAHVAKNFELPILGEPLAPAGAGNSRFSWSQHLPFALESFVYGFACFEQVYDYDADGRVVLRKLAPRPQHQISGMDVARDGGLQAVRQHDVGGRSPEVTIPVDRLVLYVHERKPGSWWGNSLLRPAYKYVVTQDPVLRVWAQLIERTGMGVVTYTGPPDVGDADADLKKGLAMAQALRAGSQAGAAVPNGAELKLQGLQGAIPDARAFMAYGDDRILDAFLANFLKLDAKGGSYALATVQEATFANSVQGKGLQVADTGTRYVVRDLVDRAFSPAEPSPRLVFDEIGSRIPLTLEGLRSMVDSKVIYPDREIEQHLRGRLGLPLKTDPAGAAPRTGPPVNV